MEPEKADVETAIADAIEQIIREHESGFTLKWVAVVETASESGQRGVWMLANDDAAAWDVLGLLEYAKQVQLGTFDTDDEDDDD